MAESLDEEQWFSGTEILLCSITSLPSKHRLRLNPFPLPYKTHTADGGNHEKCPQKKKQSKSCNSPQNLTDPPTGNPWVKRFFYFVHANDTDFIQILPADDHCHSPCKKPAVFPGEQRLTKPQPPRQGKNAADTEGDHWGADFGANHKRRAHQKDIFTRYSPPRTTSKDGWTKKFPAAGSVRST
ncbi:MAG: hypothetical protein OEV89_02440 [Desulfobulbaceae bacterium]|nr:hypothetical protein [Desulfobulbaceae bacterium]HIJ89696.1 hypothetical protein [Deltaproteobacteria bacterium]